MNTSEFTHTTHDAGMHERWHELCMTERLMCCRQAGLQDAVQIVIFG